MTQRGVRRQTTFFDERDYQTYLRLAAKLLVESSVEIWTYCLMPNHIHAVVVPHNENSLAAFFGPLHKIYAERTNLRYEWTGHLWQARYFSVPMDRHHALTAMRYVERNPLRSGLARRPQDWPWSSARGNLKLIDDPLIPGRPACGLVSPWRDYIAATESDEELAHLRDLTRTGRPEGNERFVDELEAITGRQIHRRSAGRIRK